MKGRTPHVQLCFLDNMGYVSVSTRFTFLMLDMNYIASVYVNQRYAYVKNIRLCANMLVKGLFTSDTEYQPGMSASEARKLGLMSAGHIPVPREMAFYVPKGSSWHDLYDVIKFPAKSQHIKKGVIHGDGVTFTDKGKGTKKILCNPINDLGKSDFSHSCSPIIAALKYFS